MSAHHSKLSNWTFWLGCIGVVAVLIAVGFLLMAIRAQNDLEAIREKLADSGAPMTRADILRPPVPDGENALPLLIEANFISEGSITLDGLEEALFNAEPANGQHMRYSEYTQEYIDAIRNLVGADDFRDYLALVDQATKRPTVWRDLSSHKGTDIINLIIPEVGIMMDSARYYSHRVDLYAVEGNINGAFRDLKKIFKLSDLASQDITLISGLTSIAIGSIGLWDIMLLSHLDLNNEQFKVLKTCLPASQQFKEFILSMDSERVLFAQPIWQEARENRFGIFDPSSFIGSYFASDLNWETVSYFFIPGRMDKDETAYLNYMLALRKEVLAEPFNYERFKKRIEVIENELERGLFTKLLLPTFVTVFDRYLLCDTRNHITRTALSLLQYHNDHGDYPETLDALLTKYLDEIPLDPFTGKALVYRKVESGFQLYSLGKNLADDGGYEDPDDPHEYDIVWQGRGAVLPEAP